MNGQSFLKGAIIISVGGFIAKLLGAIYRIPLTNVLGGEGMGIYQMVYPLYCLLLTVSATGIPSGLAREISHARARGDESRVRGVFLRSLALFSALGLIGFAAMLVLAPIMSRVQSEPTAQASYVMLAPSVFFVSVISCFRGYYQGKSNFTPTAVSEILEQAVKVGLGLYFAYRYRGDVQTAVSYTLFAVTLSEIAALLFMIAYHFIAGKQPHKPLYRPISSNVKNTALLKVTVPVTIAASILPLSNILDSILIVRMLSRYANNATSLYGIYAGGANTVINLPVSVCYGLAAAIIPTIAAMYAVGNAQGAEKRAAFALKCTFFISVPSAAFLLVYAEPTAHFIFRSIGGAEGEAMVRLIRYMAVSAIFLSCVQTLASCLTGKGKPKISAIAMGIAVAVKLGLEFWLLRYEKISILGAAISSGACYLVALSIDLYYIIRDKKNLGKVLLDFIRIACISAAAVGAAFPLRHMGALPILGVCAGVYLALTLLTGVFSRDELSIFQRRKHGKYRRSGN